MSGIASSHRRSCPSKTWSPRCNACCGRLAGPQNRESNVGESKLLAPLPTPQYAFSPRAERRPRPALSPLPHVAQPPRPATARTLPWPFGGTPQLRVRKAQPVTVEMQFQIQHRAVERQRHARSRRRLDQYVSTAAQRIALQARLVQASLRVEHPVLTDTQTPVQLRLHAQFALRGSRRGELRRQVRDLASSQTL